MLSSTISLTANCANKPLLEAMTMVENIPSIIDLEQLSPDDKSLINKTIEDISEAFEVSATSAYEMVGESIIKNFLTMIT